MKTPMASTRVAILVVAAVLLLSGCSLIWTLPAPGVATLVAALALVWAGATARSTPPERAVAPPRAVATRSVAGDPAQPAPSHAGDTAVVQGDPGTTRGMDAGLTTPVEGDGATEVLIGQWLAAAPDASGAPAPSGSRQQNTGGAAGDGGLEAAGAPEWQALQRALDAEAGPYVVYDASRGGAGVAERSVYRPDGGEKAVLLGDDWEATGDPGVRLAAQHQKQLNPYEGDPEAVEHGRQLFNANCGAYCHAGGAVGGGCPSLVDSFWIHGDSDAAVFSTIFGGRQGTRMAAFGASGRLSPEQIWKIIAFLRKAGKDYRLEKAGGQDSLMAQALQCEEEARATVQHDSRGETSGILVKEDEKSVTLEDRSREFPSQFRLKKKDIRDWTVNCVTKTNQNSQ